MSKIITRSHPNFDKVLEMAVEMMGGDVVASNQAAFKASIEAIELVDGELRLHFGDNVEVEKAADDDNGEVYQIKGGRLK